MSPMAFSGNPLDRASYRRSDAAWLAAQAGQGPVPALLAEPPLLPETAPGSCPGAANGRARPRVFLGLDGDQPLFAVDLRGESEPALEGGAFQEMRAAAFVLPARDTAIAGQAKALLDWHQRHGFCPNCGTATQMRDGGYRRLCPDCGAEHFPRTDPVVIMLPIFGRDECLVGPQPALSGTGFIPPLPVSSSRAKPWKKRCGANCWKK